MDRTLTELSDVIDTERYPLHDPAAPAWTAAIARARDGLAATGCAVLPGVVRPVALDRLRDEGDRVAPDAHYESRVVNVYNTAPDPTLPVRPPGPHAAGAG